MRTQVIVLVAGGMLASACSSTQPDASSPDAGRIDGGNPSGSLPSAVLRDTDTGATYDILGRGVEDPDDRLPSLVGYNQFWFAWSVFHDGSAIFNRDQPVQSGPIEADGECAVPCEELQHGCPGKDCIPALDSPRMVAPDSSEAAYLTDSDWVVGVVVEDEARAYPHNILWWHEIVNDEVAGVPIAITHCPLTFSTLAHDPLRFVDGKRARLGVSGLLFNSNLVFYDATDDTLYSQLLGVGTRGPSRGVEAPRVPMYEMSWAAWSRLFPSTTVLSDRTGFARDYTRYPYGSYFTNHDDTFGPTNPKPDPIYPAKSITFGVQVDGQDKAYVHDELAAWLRSERGADTPLTGVVNDELGGRPIAVVFDLDAGYVHAFDRSGRGPLEVVR